MGKGKGEVGDESQSLPLTDALVQLSFLVQSVVEDACAEHDTSPGQARLLGALEGRSPAMTELAALLGVERASVTGLVDRAERRGLVRRAPDPGDRRASRVHLTDQGRQTEAAFRTSVARRIEGLASGLPQTERARLAHSATRLLGVNEQVDEEKETPPGASGSASDAS
ncbi:MarR family transcriptional regulator [Streptomyces sp. NPDC050617]|uniref:MarR family winged helix-turn-helix transcriptional regulator n=1 Tax=Streptomyces sp. NPDC050617 TaxID=3154628 RepID=UPI00343CFD1E